MIRILIVDDHTLVREALRLVLEKDGDIAVVGQADNGESALTLCRELQPDVVLMDVSLGNMNGVDVTRTLIVENPALRVLTVSAHVDRRTIEMSLAAGAMGYVNKGADADELLRGVRALMEGTPFLSQDVAALLVRTYDDADGAGGNSGLGSRETEVLKLVANGNTSAEIGALLHIATGTVEVHRYNIMKKLELRGVAELTKYAIRTGLI